MLDDKTKALIIKYLRKAWLYSPARRQVIKTAETGEKNPEGEKLYYCNFYEKVGVGSQHVVPKIYVDHKVSMVPLTGFDSFTALIERLFDVDNMQTLCKLHHSLKSKEELKVRVKERKKKVKK